MFCFIFCNIIFLFFILKYFPFFEIYFYCLFLGWELQTLAPQGTTEYYRVLQSTPKPPPAHYTGGAGP